MRIFLGSRTEEKKKMRENKGKKSVFNSDRDNSIIDLARDEIDDLIIDLGKTDREKNLNGKN